MESEPISTPIVEDVAYRFEYRDEVFVCSPATDSVCIFPTEMYNHLRYWDSSNGQLVLRFLGHEALQVLVEAGIPKTQRECLLECELDQYLQQQSYYLDDEIDHLLGND